MGMPGQAPWLTAPGVVIDITGITFAQGAATVAFTLTDGNGVGLDRTGLLTNGTVAASFVMSQLSVNADSTPGQYTAYTTKQVTGGMGSATQPIAESTGTFSVVDVTVGQYTYTIAAPLTGLDPTLTQTVGGLAVRTVDGNQVIARTTFSARPDHGATLDRAVVSDANCNGCHHGLDAHGGRWTSTQQCILCHQPQNSDPSSGNTLDFKVMAHKIHRGASLPSVAGGTPYQIIGFMNSVNDFSSVVFPQNIARCSACHAGAQGDRWQTAPTTTTCTSCHDNTVFALPVPAGKVLHSGGAQPDNAACAVCHPASGGLAGIADKHLTGLIAPNATTVAFTIQSMTNTAPGQTPTLTFQALVNNAPRDLIAQPLTSVRATIAGPTTDYASEWQVTIQGSGATGTLAVVDATQGIYSYTFPASGAIPPAATGSYSVAMEAYIQPTSADPRYATVNPVQTFAVTDATPQPRRSVVALANCNTCHYSLAAHGGARTNPNYCVFCHNPATADTAGAPRFQGSSNVLAESIDFRRFIHKIHAGDQLSQPFVVGGFPLPTVANPAGTQNNFADTRYPAPLTSCGACHTSKNWTLPMIASPAYAPSTVSLMGCSESVVSTANYCDNPFWTVTSTQQLQPQTSVCTSCHDAPFTLAHAQLNTTPAGVEACATCHGAGTAFDVSLFHGTP
jgi:OmcA/MtrC family decaheme c-type cytochrome